MRPNYLRVLALSAIALLVAQIQPEVSGVTLRPRSAQAQPLQNIVAMVDVLAPAPIVALSSTRLTFDDQPVDTTSEPRSVSVNNTGAAPLAINALSTDGDYTSIHSCPISPNTLAVDASCLINIAFVPSTTGIHTGTLTITTNALNSPHTVSLSGNGIVEPVARWSGRSGPEDFLADMSFKVSADGKTWRDFSLSICSSFVCDPFEGCRCFERQGATVKTSGPIVDNQLAYNGDPLSFAGRFSSSINATGTYTYSLWEGKWEATLTSPAAWPGTIDPDTGGGITARDCSSSLLFPSGAVTTTTNVTVTTTAKPIAPVGNLKFAGRALQVVATEANGAPASRFKKPFTMKLRYTEADWQDAGVTREANLNVYSWNGSAWVPLLPCDDCSHDAVSNQFIIVLDHLTEFALLANDNKVYLPLIVKDGVASAANPAPTTTSLSPSSITAGDPSFTLTVNGTNFVNSSVVRWNGADRTTTFISTTELRATIPADDLDTQGTASVTVFTPTPGGGESNPQIFTIIPGTNPALTTSAIAPSTGPIGGGTAVTITGTGFRAGATVHIGGSPATNVTVANATQVMAVTPAHMAGVVDVVVTNPDGQNGMLAGSYTYTNPVPTTTSLSPSSAGGSGFTLTVNGTNFVGNSVVRWNGANRPTTFVSPTELQAAIPVGDLAAPGTASVTVFTPAPGGGEASPPLLFTIELVTNWITLMEENFEGSFPGAGQVFDNYPDGGEYYWNKRNCRSYAGSASGWAVGGGANGTSLACSNAYPNSADSWMVYGPFSLADATAADLAYKLWLNSEPDYDGVCALASVNGTNFYGYCDTGNSGGWVDIGLDLTNVPTLGNLMGQPQVWIAIVFASDSSITYPEGGYIDNIVLRKFVPGTTGAVPTPTLVQSVTWPEALLRTHDHRIWRR